MNTIASILARATASGLAVRRRPGALSSVAEVPRRSLSLGFFSLARRAMRHHGMTHHLDTGRMWRWSLLTLMVLLLRAGRMQLRRHGRSALRHGRLRRSKAWRRLVWLMCRRTARRGVCTAKIGQSRKRRLVDAGREVVLGVNFLPMLIMGIVGLTCRSTTRLPSPKPKLSIRSRPV